MSFPNFLQNSFPNLYLVLWTPPLVPPRHPRTFRRADENFALRTTLALIFLISCPLFADRKFIKNQIPQKATQNLQKAAKDWFFINFGTHFGILFVSCFILFRKSRKSWKSNKNQWFFNDFALLQGQVSHQIPIIFSCFFWHPFWDLIFLIFSKFNAKRAHFGSQPGSKWRPKSAKCREIVDFVRWGGDPGCVLLVTFCQLARRKGTRGAPRSFIMDFAWILLPFFMIWGPFRYILKFLARRRHSILRRSRYFLWIWQGFGINVSFISRVAKNRKKTAKYQAHNELLKNTILLGTCLAIHFCLAVLCLITSLVTGLLFHHRVSYCMLKC